MSGSFIYSEIQDDTLFKISKKNEVIPYAIFDSKAKGLTTDARAKGVELFYSLNELSFLTEVYESTRYIYYATQFSKYLYDKRSEVNHRFKEIVNDIDGVLDPNRIYTSDDNCFIGSKSK
ncbi:MAG: hypothetical protein U5K79_05935 [Cyclobacteriaceae bacterium]|nr:hypothetical protein [Cyclobacteriaceae bacterium]